MPLNAACDPWRTLLLARPGIRRAADTEGRTVDGRGSPIRRHLPLALVVVFIAWIVLIVVLIAMSPEGSAGA
ncbi:hypothetical protein GCM10010199_04310 [Dactylosporangium roseum]